MPSRRSLFLKQLSPSLRVISWLSLLAIATEAQVLQGPHALFRKNGDLVPAKAPAADLRSALEELFRGPSASEARLGVTSKIPNGTRLLSLTRVGRALRIRVNRRLIAPILAGKSLEDAVEQISKTVLRASPGMTPRIEVEDGKGGFESLVSIQGRHELPLTRQRMPPAPSPSGGTFALSGKTIALSPGHGYYWHSSLGWTTQRPNVGGLIEDVHTAEIVSRFLVPYLENLGARVLLCREIEGSMLESVLDNDQGGSVYKESGTWSRSLSTGYGNSSYRYATTSKAGGSTATWSWRVLADGTYPVYAWFRAGSNRCRAARYHITHAGGIETLVVDQTRDSMSWRFLGCFYFEKGTTARVTLDSASTDVGRVVIADAVKLGAGFGSIARGGRTSGKARYLECSRYWAQYAGAPRSVYDSVASGQDNSDDVTCRPRFAEWRGADLYFSLHTNAGGGTGTSSFIHNTSPTAGSARLQSLVHSRVLTDIRSLYRSSWVDRGRQKANFGELRLLSTMPGVLLELAFHDRDNSVDHNALHDPEFRRIAARAIARGILRYFHSAAPFPPTRPTAFFVVQDGKGGLRLGWDPVSGASGYEVEVSDRGKGFRTLAVVNSNRFATGKLAVDSIQSYRVRAVNQTGRSFPTEVLTAGTSHTWRSELLMVQGFDRLGEFVKSPENTRDYMRLHGAAIREGQPFSLGFDAASNEAVILGRVSLSGYRAVNWLLGEESTADETLSSKEQALLKTYLAAGGRLVLSGSEVLWDLDRKGSVADRAFVSSVLGVRYARDDAQTYRFRAVPGATFDGLPAGRFDDGSQGTYDVDYPDVLVPADSKSRAALYYGASGSDIAAIERVSGNARVLTLGFPLETVTSPSLRASIMRRALRFVLADRSLEVPERLALGRTSMVPLLVPASAGSLYALAASSNTQPALSIGARVLPLRVDALFGMSFAQQGGVFQGFAGFLDARGRASAKITIPMLPTLIGLRFHVSGLVVDSRTLALRELLPRYLTEIR